MNLVHISDLARRFNVVVGLSDHSRSQDVPVAAIALGARIIEKHLTLSRSDGGPDAEFSFEPDELAALGVGCRTAHAALGNCTYDCSPSEVGNRVFRRSLYIVTDLRAGDVLTPVNVRSIRPAFGLAPKHFEAVVGRKLNRDTARGTPLSWELLEPL